MDVPRTLRKLVPIMLLAALAALLAGRRRTRAATPVVVPAAEPPLLLPPVEEALVVAEQAAPADVTVVASAERIEVPEPIEIRASADPAPAGRFERDRVDIITVVDDLLGPTG